MSPAQDDMYFNAPGVATVRWDAPTATVLVEWEGWANSDEFKALLSAELSALKDHSGTRLLADCRKQRVLSPADQDQADREWLPAALGVGLKRFAIVLPVSALAAMNLQDRLSRVPEGKLEVGYFATIDQARAWLEEQPRSW